MVRIGIPFYVTVNNISLTKETKRNGSDKAEILDVLTYLVDNCELEDLFKSDKLKSLERLFKDNYQRLNTCKQPIMSAEFALWVQYQCLIALYRGAVIDAALDAGESRSAAQNFYAFLTMMDRFTKETEVEVKNCVLNDKWYGSRTEEKFKQGRSWKLSVIVNEFEAQYGRELSSLRDKGKMKAVPGALKRIETEIPVEWWNNAATYPYARRRILKFIYLRKDSTGSSDYGDFDTVGNEPQEGKIYFENLKPAFEYCRKLMMEKVNADFPKELTVDVKNISINVTTLPELLAVWTTTRYGRENVFRTCPMCGRTFRVGENSSQVYCSHHTPEQRKYYRMKLKSSGFDLKDINPFF